MSDGVSCEGCGAEFRPKRKWQRFCGASCRNKNWREKHVPSGENLRRLIRQTVVEMLEEDVEFRGRVRAVLESGALR